MAEKRDFFEVLVIESSTGRIERRIGCGPIQEIEKVEQGVLINLDHTKFHTEIVEAPL